MNRREFTASLAAAAALPVIPLAGPAPAAVPTAVVPPGAYAWAQLIARAQNRCSPAMLARHLHLSADAAGILFEQMVRDGVLRAPTAAGVARAATPLQVPGAARATLGQKLFNMRDRVGLDVGDQEEQSNEAPLAKHAQPCLGCADTQTKEDPHASQNQHLQTGAQER